VPHRSVKGRKGRPDPEVSDKTQWREAGKPPRAIQAKLVYRTYGLWREKDALRPRDNHNRPANTSGIGPSLIRRQRLGHRRFRRYKYYGYRAFGFVLPKYH
jgi:hypothetical protein